MPLDLKCRVGNFFHIKEIGALKVSIALFIAGMNGDSFDGGLDARVREVSFIQSGMFVIA